MQVFGQDIRKVIGLVDSDTKLEPMPNRPRAYGGAAAVWYNGVAESGGALNPPVGGNEDQQDGVDGNADPANSTSNTTGAGGTGSSDVSHDGDWNSNPDDPPNEDPFPPLGGNAGGFMGGLGDCGDPDGRCINVRWDGQTPLPDGWEYQQDPDRDSNAEPSRPNWGFAPTGGWSGKCCQRFSYSDNLHGSDNPCFLTMGAAWSALKASLKGMPWVCPTCGCESNHCETCSSDGRDSDCGYGVFKPHSYWIINNSGCPNWQGGGGHIAESCGYNPIGDFRYCNLSYSGNCYQEKFRCPCLNPAQYPDEYPDYKKLPDGYCSEISFGDDYQFHNSYGDADKDNKVIEGDDTENSVTLCDEDGIPVTFSADLNGVKITKNGHYVVVDPKTNKIVDKGTV